MRIVMHILLIRDNCRVQPLRPARGESGQPGHSQPGLRGGQRQVRGGLGHGGHGEHRGGGQGAGGQPQMRGWTLGGRQEDM